MKTNKNIAFFLYSITGSGQAKVILDIAGGLVDSGFNVYFFFTNLENTIYYNQYLTKIKFIPLRVEGRLRTVFALAKALKKTNVTILITGGNDNNCSAIIAKLISRVKMKLIISEHNSITQIVKNSKHKFIALLPVFVHCLYPFADALVSVSYGIEKELRETINLKHKKSQVIYNPVINKSLIEKSFCSVEHQWLQGKYKVFLGVGRLSVQKDFSNLINAFKQIAIDKSFKLLILGNGEEREILEESIVTLGLADQVELVGRVENPYAYMRQANVFVLSSKFEGLPTVLIEALACGLPVVSTDCPHGPKEILENGKWGKLVPVSNTDALAKAMLETLKQPKNLGLERAYMFTSDISIEKYTTLINSFD